MRFRFQTAPVMSIVSEYETSSTGRWGIDRRAENLVANAIGWVMSL
jgi:hypothetical protein